MPAFLRACKRAAAPGSGPLVTAPWDGNPLIHSLDADNGAHGAQPRRLHNVTSEKVLSTDFERVEAITNATNQFLMVHKG